MNSQKPDRDRLAYHVGSINLSGLTMTKVILWLVSITIVSFVTGFGILALSGDFFPGPEQKAALFNDTAFMSPDITSFPLDGALSGDIRITFGAGELALKGGAPAGQLMEATVFSERPEMQPDFKQGLNNSQMMVTMTETGHKKKDWFAAHSPGSWANTWNVRIGDEVPVAVTVHAGAGDCELILGTINLTSLTVNTGVGDTTIDLAGYHGGVFNGEIHNGVGELTLRIPKKSNIRILMHHGVGDITTRGIVQTDEHYMTAGFNPALPVNEIIVTQGVGSIQLEAV